MTLLEWMSAWWRRATPVPERRTAVVTMQRPQPRVPAESLSLYTYQPYTAGLDTFIVSLVNARREISLRRTVLSESPCEGSHQGCRFEDSL